MPILLLPGNLGEGIVHHCLNYHNTERRGPDQSVRPISPERILAAGKWSRCDMKHYFCARARSQSEHGRSQPKAARQPGTDGDLNPAVALPSVTSEVKGDDESRHNMLLPDHWLAGRHGYDSSLLFSVLPIHSLTGNGTPSQGRS